MKYYFFKATDSVSEDFGGETYGPLIRLRPKYANDHGLLEYEKTHVRQWYALMAIGVLLCTMLTLFASSALWPVYGLAPWLHTLLYKFVRPYRRWSEVQAYRKQIATGGYNNAEFAVTALVEKYGLRLTVDEARTLLTN